MRHAHTRIGRLLVEILCAVLLIPAAVPNIASAAQRQANSGPAARSILPPSYVPRGPGKVIIVARETTVQHLWAYQAGHPVLQTPVTTGKPGEPTVLGTFHVFYKASPFTFHSWLPQNDPEWYPPSPTHWAMEFQINGYFIHDAPWRSAYGPYTNLTGDRRYPLGTHGCVNVPYKAMQELYSWADPRTTVIVI